MVIRYIVRTQGGISINAKKHLAICAGANEQMDSLHIAPPLRAIGQ